MAILQQYLEKQATVVDVVRVESNPLERRLKSLASPAPILVAIDHCCCSDMDGGSSRRRKGSIGGKERRERGREGEKERERQAASSRSRAVNRRMPSCALGNLQPTEEPVVGLLKYAHISRSSIFGVLANRVLISANPYRLPLQHRACPYYKTRNTVWHPRISTVVVCKR